MKKILLTLILVIVFCVTLNAKKEAETEIFAERYGFRNPVTGDSIEIGNWVNETWAKDLIQDMRHEMIVAGFVEIPFSFDPSGSWWDKRIIMGQRFSTSMKPASKREESKWITIMERQPDSSPKVNDGNLYFMEIPAKYFHPRNAPMFLL
jgi:hypothetical protein